MVRVAIDIKHIEAPKSILILLKNEKARFDYINAVFPKMPILKKCKLMDVSDRTFYRIAQTDSEPEPA